MARWHSLGLLMLLAGCSLDTGPNGATLTPSTSTSIWSPARRPGMQQPQTTAARDAGMDARAPEKPEKTADASAPADADHSPNTAGAPSMSPAMTPPPATNANDPDANVGSKPAVTDAGSANPSSNGPAADGGGSPASMTKPSSTQPDKGGAGGSGAASGSSMSTPDKEAGSGDDDKDEDKGRGSRKHDDDEDDRGRDDDKTDDSRPGTDDKGSATQTSDGTLSLLFTSISNLVFSILDFSFGPAKPQNITNLVVSIVTLATLPASEVTTATLSDLLEQLDDSNVCHDDRSACEALCETLVASCDLYKHDPRSVKSVERNCGAKALAGCK